MSGKQTRNSWTDTVGQIFQVGDYIAVASTKGRSPQMVIARVESINTHHANGEPITEYVGWDRETRERIEKPSVTVTAKPVLDGRGFHRSTTRWIPPEKRGPDGEAFEPIPGGPRSVTYLIPGNILKLSESAVNHLTEKLLQS